MTGRRARRGTLRPSEYRTVLGDANTVPNGDTLEADVCIVGAGTAGIAIALELAGTDIGVVLLESGGLQREKSIERLNIGESDGLPYSALDACRSRFLGGSTNCWGGWSRPLDAEDFEPREWVQGSGWPIRFADLATYYGRATELLQLGQADYDPMRFERQIGNPRARLIRFESERMETKVLRFSPPARFGDLYRASLERAPNIRCLLHANAVAIETDADASCITAVRAATLEGRSFRVEAKSVVLSAGGIENPRLLLLSDDVQPAGLGNGHDLVGRYFMDHPSLLSGQLRTTTTSPPLDLYDDTFSFHNPALAVDGVSVAAYLTATPAVSEREGLLRHRLLFHTTYSGEEAAGTQALRRLTGRARRFDRSPRKHRDLALVARHAPRVVTAIAGRRLKIRALERRRWLTTIVEPEPTPESRVTLADTRDALGLRRARVTWRLTERVDWTISRAQQILREELERAGVGVLELDPRGAAAQDGKLWCWHHIGTTRMSADQRHGVVDADCRVHGISNLYIAGSSVFPTAGCDMPTLTIVALAIRTADHLRASLAGARRRRRAAQVA